MKLIVFPGNPGKQYKKTRHNLPQMVLDKMDKVMDLTWKEKFNSLWCKAQTGTKSSILLMPMVFMNNTGKSVQAAAAFFKIKDKDILVLHDDVELPFGAVRFKLGGGAGGHNGLRSIANSLSSNGFSRLRLGISRPSKRDVASYVLGRFTPAEEAELPDFIQEIITELIEIIETQV